MKFIKYFEAFTDAELDKLILNKNTSVINKIEKNYTNKSEVLSKYDISKFERQRCIFRY